MSLRDTSTERADQSELDRQRRETLGDPLHAAVLRELRPKDSLMGIPVVVNEYLPKGTIVMAPHVSHRKRMKNTLAGYPLFT